MKAVVMAGGEGSRLRPMTTHRPKPLVPVGNRPIMEHILSLLARHGVCDVIATLHYLADEIQGYFDDGSEFGVNLSYSIEDLPLGTAGSVKKAEDFINNERFILISGDALTDCDLAKAIQFHEAKGSLATVVLSRVQNPLEFGVVITDEQGRIVRFLEKPNWSEVFSDTVNTGIYILEPEILKMMEPGKAYDWAQDIFPRMLQEGQPLFGYIMEDYWCDVGTLNQYREANSALLSGKVGLSLPWSEISPGVWVGSDCAIDEEAILVPPLCLGNGCKVKKNAVVGPYTIMGDNALIEEEAKVERSIVWDSAYIGQGARVRSAILCGRVTLKEDASVKEEAVVGDRCLLDVGSAIQPHVKLWPNKIIERGATVTMSLVWGNKWHSNLFRKQGVAGLSNIEITPDFATRLGSAYGSILPEGSSVVTCRDSTRSSIMIKRALSASLISVGCTVLDLRNTALPVARHFIRSSNVTGAVNIRKLPDNHRMTLIEFLDQNGAYLSRALERKIESAFYREDFHRIDSENLGVIEFANRANEEYQSDFLKHIQHYSKEKRFKIVCDYGYTPVSSILPGMLGKMNLESIGLNGFNDAKLTPRFEADLQRHLSNLSQIVSTLDYDLGVLFTEEGERLSLVDRKGRILGGGQLLAVMCLLIAKTQPKANIALSVTTSKKLEKMLQREGARVVRTKADIRALMLSAIEENLDFVGDDKGGFITPVMHPGFDAMSALARLISMLRATHTTLDSWVDWVPEFPMAYEQVKCPWELKGTVMRKLTEDAQGYSHAELLDGIKVYDGDAWVLILPDEAEPIFHIRAEGENLKESKELIRGSVCKIQSMIENAA